MVGIPGHEIHDPEGVGMGEFGSEFAEVAVLPAEMSRHDLGDRVAIERVDAGEGVVKNGTQGIEVGAGVEGGAFELLGGHEKD